MFDNLYLNDYDLYIMLFCLVLLLIIIRRRNNRVKKMQLQNNQNDIEIAASNTDKRIKIRKLFAYLILFSVIAFGLFYVNNQYLIKIQALEQYNQNVKEENNMLMNRISSFYNETDSLYILTNKQYEQIRQLESSLDDTKIKVPTNYYYNTSKDGSLSELTQFLNEVFTMPVEYKIHIFDCSENAAFMERELENAGFDTFIVLGDSPNGSDVKHAWLLVYTSDNYKVAIEPTALLGGMDGETQKMFANLNGSGRGMISSSENQAYYDDFDSIVPDIYQAIDTVNFEEFDWWYGMWDLEI